MSNDPFIRIAEDWDRDYGSQRAAEDRLERYGTEYIATKNGHATKTSGKNELMADYPVESLSIQMRERIVLPLATIQQYAIMKMREMERANYQLPAKNSYGKLAMRCSFGIIHAGRNSA